MIEQKKLYNIIYADPPWHYNDRRNSHTRFCGGARTHYNVLSTEDICKFKVKDISADNCMLFLWATWPNLEEAFKVIKAWDFEYKTLAFIWIKRNANNNPWFGIGYYTKSNSEPCLLAVKGQVWNNDNHVSQVFEQEYNSQKEKHSKKPDEIRRKIVQLCGDLPRIELFAREYYAGWDCFGNEVLSDVTL